MITFLQSIPQDYLGKSCSGSLTDVKGATSRFRNVPAKFFKFVCNPCQFCPSLTILVPLLYNFNSLLFSYLSKLLFSGFLLFF